MSEIRLKFCNDIAKLYYRSGTSDKVYFIRIINRKNSYLFDVIVEYGRRDSKLKQETKNTRPLSYKEADALFQRIVQQKVAKGYTTDSFGVPFSSSLSPQLEKEECVPNPPPPKPRGERTAPLEIIGAFQTEQDLPKSNSSMRGKAAFIITTQALFVCTGQKWDVMGTSSKDSLATVFIPTSNTEPSRKRPKRRIKFDD